MAIIESEAPDQLQQKGMEKKKFSITIQKRPAKAIPLPLVAVSEQNLVSEQNPADETFVPPSHALSGSCLQDETAFAGVRPDSQYCDANREAAAEEAARGSLIACDVNARTLADVRADVARQFGLHPDAAGEAGREDAAKLASLLRAAVLLGQTERSSVLAAASKDVRATAYYLGGLPPDLRDRLAGASSKTAMANRVSHGDRIQCAIRALVAAEDHAVRMGRDDGIGIGMSLQKTQDGVGFEILLFHPKQAAASRTARTLCDMSLGRGSRSAGLDAVLKDTDMMKAMLYCIRVDASLLPTGTVAAAGAFPLQWIALYDTERAKWAWESKMNVVDGVDDRNIRIDVSYITTFSIPAPGVDAHHVNHEFERKKIAGEMKLAPATVTKINPKTDKAYEEEVVHVASKAYKVASLIMD